MADTSKSKPAPDDDSTVLFPPVSAPAPTTAPGVPVPAVADAVVDDDDGPTDPVQEELERIIPDGPADEDV